MKSNLEKLFRAIFEMVQGMSQDMAATAWVALGVVLVVLIVIGVLSVRWIRSGGLAGGSSSRFLADRRKLVSWLKSN